MILKLDKMDQRILDTMQKNGSITNQELADEVGLSPSPCSRRVKHLEDEGIIDRYATLLSPRKLGLKLTAMAQITMDRHNPDRLENFERELATYPEVISCVLFTGQSADYMVVLLLEDMESYQEILLNKITRIAGVTGVKSSFVLKRIIDRTSVPLTHLN